MPPKQTTKYVNKKRVRMPPEIERGTTEFRATQAQRGIGFFTLGYFTLGFFTLGYFTLDKITARLPPEKMGGTTQFRATHVQRDKRASFCFCTALLFLSMCGVWV